MRTGQLLKKDSALRGKEMGDNNSAVLVPVGICVLDSLYVPFALKHEGFLCMYVCVCVCVYV